MQEMMLSVAIITYNQEDYIAQTLDSILNQEHDYKYEIVIGEDNSSDNTRKIIEEYAAKYPEIIKPLYNNPNKGLIKNYFNVIEHCQGKYIMECAGDDYWLPGKVKTQIAYMENHPDVGMCYGLAQVFVVDEGKFRSKNFGSNKETFDSLLIGNDIPAMSICMRTALIHKYVADICPIEKNWILEDYPLWLWFSAESKISFIAQEVCVYRELSESASHSHSLERYLTLEKCTHEIQCFFANRYGRIVPYFDLEEKAFLFLYVQLKQNYSTDLARQLCQRFFFIKKKNLYHYLKVLCSFSPLLIQFVDRLLNMRRDK